MSAINILGFLTSQVGIVAYTVLKYRQDLAREIPATVVTGESTGQGRRQALLLCSARALCTISRANGVWCFSNAVLSCVLSPGFGFKF